METLIVDAEGKVTIPSEVLHKRGLRPGDAVTLVESAEGLLVYQGGVDPKTLAWWRALSHEEQQQAAAEACPLFHGAAKMQHWSFPDPSKATGSEEEQLAVYRHVRDAIRARIENELIQEAGGMITLAPLDRDEA